MQKWKGRLLGGAVQCRAVDVHLGHQALVKEQQMAVLFFFFTPQIHLDLPVKASRYSENSRQATISNEIIQPVILKPNNLALNLPNV